MKYGKQHADGSRSGGQKPAEPDWIEHDGSAVCPVPAGHDVEVRFRGAPFDCDERDRSPQNWAWYHDGEQDDITHYRDWTAFKQQQASAGEVPRLLTPEQAARISELREPELILGALTLAGLIAPEPEPVDPLVAALASIDISLSDHELQKLKDMGVAVTAPARGEEA